MDIAQTLKRTALYEKHQQAGAKLVPFAGYEMPLRYAGDVAEHLAVRTTAGLFDVSHMGEFLVRGPHALDLIQKVTTNDVSKVPVGKAQYNCMMRTTGGIVDDLIVYHLEPELYMLVVNASNLEKDWAWIVENNTVGAQLEDISDKTSLLALSGPNAQAILQKLTNEPIAELPYYALLKGTVDGIANVVVATTGYTGERTFELYLRNADAPKLWDDLLAAGQDLGLQPAGLGARDSLRLEMGYLLYGNDIDETTHPLEAGLGWITKFDKGDFIGKSVLEQVKAQGGPTRKLVAVETLDRGIPRKGLELQHEGRIVGTFTSGVFSPSLKTGVGLAYVETALAKPGQELDLDVRGKLIRSKVVKAPFVKNTSLK